MKRIAICCDGTWCKPDMKQGGKPCPTNVAKLARAVAQQDEAGVTQVVHYHEGVGTKPGEHLIGGLTGFGLSANIKAAYSDLVADYDPGDEIFLFGFSRGAYTARSLAGFIRNCGILRREYTDKIDEAYALYRRRDPASRPGQAEAQQFRNSYTYEDLGEPVTIKFIGVWDTVGALGIPVPVVARISVSLLRLQFHDVELSGCVRNAFQALAIDEKRSSFAPSIWEQSREKPNQRIEQVWFAGVHGNVGGGCRDAGVSDAVLAWMRDRARECGLAVDEGVLSQMIDPQPYGALAESWTGIFRLIRAAARKVCSPRPGSLTYESPHPWVTERLQLDRSYRPQNLPARYWPPGTEPDA